MALGSVARLDRVALTAAVRTEAFRESSPALGDGARLKRRALEDGYLFFRGLVPPDTVLALRRTVLTIAERYGWLALGSAPMDGMARQEVRLGAYDDPRWVAFLCEVLPLESFRALGLHPRLLGVLRQICDGPVAAHEGDLCRVVSPGSPDFTTLPHQDRHYVRAAGELWTAWLPLGDCPLDLGPLAVLPRSHLSGLMPHAGEGAGKQGVTIPEEATWAGEDLAAGDVIFFHGLTVHRALDNVTPDHLRISVDYRYQAIPEALPVRI